MKYNTQFKRSPSIVASADNHNLALQGIDLSSALDQTHSPYLQLERDRLSALMDAVRQSGSVAPANCWVTEIEQTKNGHTYRYVRLVSASKQMRSRLLGRPGCESDRDWRQRCQRRDMIFEIEQQVSLLIELIDRQATRPIEFQSDEADFLHGKSFDHAENLKPLEVAR